VELRRSIEAFHARHDRSSSGGSGGAAAREGFGAPGLQEAQQKPGPGGGAAPHRDVLNHRTGTLEYSAPEMLSKPTAAEVFHLVIGQGMDEEELPTYDEKVDVWAVGAVTFEALTGRQPFLADGAAEMAAVVAARLEAHDSASGVPAFIAGVKGLTDECRDFLARCFASAPVARPSAAELLEHPWLVRHTGQAGRSGAGTPTASPPVARLTRVMSDVPSRAGGLAELGAAAEPHASDCGAHHATPPVTLAPDLSRTRSLRRGVTASAADLDLTRPMRSATGRLEAPSRVAAAAAVGTAEA
jgi:serine/threonine protein kinase